MHPRALQSGAYTLHHKQGIAPSGPEDLSQVPAFERFRRFALRQFGRLLGVQRLKRNFESHPQLPQSREKPRERMLAARLFRPDRPKHEYASGGGRSQRRTAAPSFRIPETDIERRTGQNGPTVSASYDRPLSGAS
ncbi:MAG: hypothetical protein ACR2IV_08165, partial [Bryobacteraceae bacterium]